MKETQAAENYWTIGHLAQATGLTDRTIRNYIASGILTGEKVNGLWQFTPEQVDAFVRHPSVRPSILAKKNSIVYDFLLDAKKTGPEACLVLDMPGEDKKAVSAFFCGAISGGGFTNIRFSFDGVEKVCRVILEGNSGEVLALANHFYNR